MSCTEYSDRYRGKMRETYIELSSDSESEGRLKPPFRRRDYKADNDILTVPEDDDEVQIIEAFRDVVPDRQYHLSESVADQWKTVNRCTVQQGWKIKPQTFVELLPADGQKSRDFLEVKVILKHRYNNEFILRGNRYRRTRGLKGLLEKKLNEVCMVQTYNAADPRDAFEQALEDVSIQEVLCERTLIKTNQSFPALSVEHPASRFFSEARDREDSAHLVCRWKFTAFYKDAQGLRSGKWNHCSLARLRSHEVDDAYAISDKELRAQVRPHHVRKPSRAERYTFCDAFHGAGGVSCGARAAGLDIKVAFDAWADANATYQMNNEGVMALLQLAEEFILRRTPDGTVDVVHISMPCQFVSAAHTVPGKDDEANQAALFTVMGITQTLKPRVVTIEEAEGIVTHNQSIYLRAVILQLTTLGYSVAWKALNCAEYGAAQKRKRLVAIASCPGEPLPPFPTPTHGPVPPLKPFTTIFHALSPIRPNTPNHDLSRTTPRHSLPYTPHQQLRACITTGGGDANVHPCGTRSFTERELACLQSFPVDYVFFGGRTSVKRQIGNAMPPVVAERVLGCVVRALRETDRREEREEREKVRVGSVETGREARGSAAPVSDVDCRVEEGSGRRNETAASVVVLEGSDGETETRWAHAVERNRSVKSPGARRGDMKTQSAVGSGRRGNAAVEVVVLDASDGEEEQEPWSGKGEAGFAIVID